MLSFRAFLLSLWLVGGQEGKSRSQMENSNYFKNCDFLIDVFEILRAEEVNY